MGPILLVGGVSLFLNVGAHKTMALEVLRSPALLFLAGVLTMTAGLAVLLNHNLWVGDWRVLITIFGWIATIGGAARIALPQQARSFGETMLDKPTAMTVGGAIWVAIGVLFCFFGYIR
jgi:hypothetical protein